MPSADYIARFVLAAGKQAVGDKMPGDAHTGPGIAAEWARRIDEWGYPGDPEFWTEALNRLLSAPLLDRHQYGIRDLKAAAAGVLKTAPQWRAAWRAWLADRQELRDRQLAAGTFAAARHIPPRDPRHTPPPPTVTLRERFEAVKNANCH